MRHTIAVASPSYPASMQDALKQIRNLSGMAAARGASIVCFPETFLPGYPGEEFAPEQCSKEQLEEALQAVCTIAAAQQVAIIIPMDWYEGDALVNTAFVVTKEGQISGSQTKNQLDPSEDAIWAPGTRRQVFAIDGLCFGIVICHEGFRYPEAVRWMARHGAQVVFHPNLTGSNVQGHVPEEWGARESPYYEKAQMMRALENTIYYASSNYAFRYPESASAVIAPDGTCLAWQAYGVPGVAAATIDTDLATGLLARRFKPELLQ
jgi:predicted amidohydrolase